jgi:N-acyl homoserine lactone hydrolase
MLMVVDERTRIDSSPGGRLIPLSERADVDLAGIDIVINTHLHFDHCGGNHLFAGKPIYVQRGNSTTRGPGRLHDPRVGRGTRVQYVPVDGELEVLPGLRLGPAPGHTPGSQVVVVETGGRPVVVCGDAAVWHGELDEPSTEGQRLVRALDPESVWVSHAEEPWRPPVSPAWPASGVRPLEVRCAGSRLSRTHVGVTVMRTIES